MTTFKYSQELDNLFNKCSIDSLSAKETYLVSLAAQLSKPEVSITKDHVERARTEGISFEELHRIACLCACNAGPKVQDAYMKLLDGMAESVAGVGSDFAKSAHSLDISLFRANRLCSSRSLERKTTHLAALASCLVTGCACASGHIVAAREAGATDEEIIRTACIAACDSGLNAKYSFLAHLQFVDEEKGVANLWADAYRKG